MNYNNNFNFLRLVAAISVVVSHAYIVVGKYDLEPLRVLSNNTILISTIGLYIFFFASGLLVTKSALESEGTLHFLFKRILRIYPALIVVVIISVFIAGPVLTRLNISAYYQHEDSWKYLWTMTGFRMRLFLPGVFDTANFKTPVFNIPLWSIRLEMILYFSLALLLAPGFIHKKVLHSSICIGIIIATLTIFLLNAYGHPTGITINQKEGMLVMAFFFGSLVQIAKPSAKLLAILFVMAVVSFALRITRVLSHPLVLDEVLTFSIFTWMIAFTNLFRIRIKNDLSYGIYIFTFPIQQIFFMLTGFNINPFINLALSLVTSACLAFLSWKYIEEPLLQLKSYYRLIIPFKVKR